MTCWFHGFPLFYSNTLEDSTPNAYLIMVLLLKKLQAAQEMLNPCNRRVNTSENCLSPSGVAKFAELYLMS